MRPSVGLDSSPLAEVYDETVDQLLEVLAEKDRLQGRVKELEREMRLTDEQLSLFAGCVHEGGGYALLACARCFRDDIR